MIKASGLQEIPLVKTSTNAFSDGMNAFLCIRRFLLIALLTLTLQLAGCGWLTHPSLEDYSSLHRTPLPVSKDSLHVRFFGTTTIQIDDGETALMIDGFFSRPSLPKLALSLISPNFASIGPNEKRIVEALEKGKVNKLAAVLVTHSHFDHALDSAFVACRKNALLVGSESTANIGRGQGLQNDQIYTPQEKETLKFGKFQVDVFTSLHSPDSWFQGKINEVLIPPASANAYKEGGTYSFLIRHEWGAILIHPSANYIPNMFNGIHADVIFLSIGSLGTQKGKFVNAYWNEVVAATEPAVVVPIHWDDFFRPLDQPLIPMSLGDNFTAGMDKVIELANAGKIRIELLPPFEAFDLNKNDVLPRQQNRLEGRTEKRFIKAFDSENSCHLTSQ